MTADGTASTTPVCPSDQLSLDEYKRYGRQMILDGFGLPGQLKLKAAKVAVIGAGGLGCPTLQYLVGAGVGYIGIFDFDRVEESNLHRQILHTTDRVGWYKAESAKFALQAINPYPSIQAITSGITPSNALTLLRGHDLILDCTDRPQTRYLISDASVRLSIPLVSGAAISHGGQLATYGGTNSIGKKRACYRCIWPKPLPNTAGAGAGTCEEEGVWGPVTGLVGTAMAAEAIKLLIGMAADTSDPEPKLTMMSLAPSATPFRTIRIRGPSAKCIACGPDSTITDDLDAVGYEAFCGMGGDDAQAESSSSVERIDVTALDEALKADSAGTRVILDVRTPVEFGICALPGSINLPLQDLLRNPSSVLGEVAPREETTTIYTICRRGNDSLTAACIINKLKTQNEQYEWLQVRDVRGGVRAWSRDVDPSFPTY